MSTPLYVGVMFLICGTVHATSQATYAFQGNPYNSSGVYTTSEFAVDPTVAPVGAVVYAPNIMNATHAMQFSVIWFVGGYDGFVPGWGYSQMLRQLASHGFIVVAITDIRCTDMVSPLPFLTSARAWMHIDWLQEHLAGMFLSSAMGPLSADWSKLVLMCHSGGCEITMGMNAYHPNANSLIAANINIGPYFNSYAGYGQLFQNRTTPSLSFATALAEGGYPSCSFPGSDYATLYEQWPTHAPKMMFLVPKRGHCDIYDDDRWYGCSPYVSNWCATNVSCGYKLYPTQHCNLTSNGAAKQYKNQSSLCNATSAAEKPCWARYDNGTVWGYTMGYASQQNGSQAISACYNDTQVCAQWNEHIQQEPRTRYRRVSSGVVIAFLSRFALGDHSAEPWLTTGFPKGMQYLQRNFGGGGTCIDDVDCPSSYCLNDPTKTPPFQCH